MDDQELFQSIQKMVDEEHALMNQGQQSPLTDEQHARMKEIEVRLDQCWDLLRQRRAKRDFGLNPDEAHVRDADTVEHYKQ